MFNTAKPYDLVISYLADTLPSKDYPGEVIRESENRAEILAYIYNKDYDSVLEDLISEYRILHDIEPEED